MLSVHTSFLTAERASTSAACNISSLSYLSWASAACFVLSSHSCFADISMAMAVSRLSVASCSSFCRLVSCFLRSPFYNKNKCELQHDKQQNDLCNQRRLRSAWVSVQYDQESSLCAWWEAKDPMFLYADCEDLSGCPGWSESLMGAHAILLVLSYCGSLRVNMQEDFIQSCKLGRVNFHFSISPISYMIKFVSYISMASSD